MDCTAEREEDMSDASAAACVYERGKRAAALAAVSAVAFPRDTTSVARVCAVHLHTATWQIEDL